MTADPTDPRAEIVIVRRKSGGGDDGHHGGAWKIAYADFVTAMMAFFLVMWLINASNEATRAQVASYFNPIKLTDSSTAKRGLTEPKETFKTKQQPADENQPEEPKAGEMALAQEDKLLHDPQRVLESLAAKDKGAAKIAAAAADKETGAEAEPSPLPEGFDPFDPQTWQAVPKLPTEHGEAEKPSEHQAEEQPAEHAKAEEPAEHQVIEEPVDHQAAEEKPAEKQMIEESVEHQMTEPNREPAAKAPPHDPSTEKPAETEHEKPAIAEEAAPETNAEQAKQDPHPQPESQSPEAGDKKPSVATIAAAEAIRAEILSRFGAGNQPLPANLDVKPTFEGVLISLTDKHEFGMFALGSAEPDPKLVTLIATIADVLNDKPGFVVVRGHTDARPYRNKKYDNWQLSTARAHMAVYMMERGGIDPQRIRRVEGHADRDLKDSANPQSERNRRIEILLGGLTP